MIISDLSYFEVVSEPANVVGGARCNHNKNKKNNNNKKKNQTVPTNSKTIRVRQDSNAELTALSGDISGIDIIINNPENIEINIFTGDASGTSTSTNTATVSPS